MIVTIPHHALPRRPRLRRSRLIPLAFVVVGCGALPYATSRSAPTEIVPPNTNESVSLVVRQEIVNACPELAQLRSGGDAVSIEKRWLVILDRLADCMLEGALRNRTIVLHGAVSSCKLVAEILEERGVDHALVATLAVPSELGSLLEISLASSPTFAPADGL